MLYIRNYRYGIILTSLKNKALYESVFVSLWETVCLEDFRCWPEESVLVT